MTSPIIKHNIMTTVTHDGVKYTLSISGKGIRISHKVTKKHTQFVNYDWEQLTSPFTKPHRGGENGD